MGSTAKEFQDIRVFTQWKGNQQIGQIVLAKPERGNSLSSSTLGEFIRALKMLQENDSIRAVVLSSQVL